MALFSNKVTLEEIKSIFPYIDRAYAKMLEGTCRDIEEVKIKGLAHGLKLKVENSSAFMNGRAKALQVLENLDPPPNIPNTGKFEVIARKNGLMLLEGKPYGPGGKYQDWKVGQSESGTMTVFDSKTAAQAYLDKQ